MKIVQATFGTFHHFELARELERRGHLERIYSTFPWKRLEREGIVRDKVETFPWVHTAQILLERRNLVPARFQETLHVRNATTFDAWIADRVPECDALIALSGAALRSARQVKGRGGKYVCDRGSTHRIYQRDLLREEAKLWKQPPPAPEEREEAREAEIYDLADVIVVPSSAARRSFLEKGHDPARVHAIPYGVRLEKFYKMAAPPSLAAPGTRFEVLFVGGVSLRKGVPYLLKAFAALQHPNKRLRLIGALAEEFRPLLATLPQEHVELLGALPQAELVEYMSRSHVMVLPSIEEGLALVQGQALACGCPVIATTATGGEDLFTDGMEGFIVPIRDPAAVTQRLERFLDDPTLRERMSEAALRRVQSIGGWSAYGDRWEQMLHQLTGK